MVDLRKIMGCGRRSMGNAKGFTLIELAISVGIIGMVTYGIMSLLSTVGQQSEDQAVAQQLQILDKDLQAYVNANYSSLCNPDTSVPPKCQTALQPITAATLASYLGTESTTNAFGQNYSFYVVPYGPQRQLVGAVVATSATTDGKLNDMRGGRIAALVGADGGIVYASNATTIDGAFGGYSIPLATFGLASLPDSPAAVSFYNAQGTTTSGYLKRFYDGSSQAANTKNTQLVMGPPTTNTTQTGLATGAQNPTPSPDIYMNGNSILDALNVSATGYVTVGTLGSTPYFGNMGLMVTAAGSGGYAQIDTKGDELLGGYLMVSNGGQVGSLGPNGITVGSTGSSYTQIDNAGDVVVGDSLTVGSETLHNSTKGITVDNGNVSVSSGYMTVGTTGSGKFGNEGVTITKPGSGVYAQIDGSGDEVLGGYLTVFNGGQVGALGDVGITVGNVSNSYTQIDGSGNMVMGGSLTVGGATTSTPGSINATAFYYNSDRALKKDIVPLAEPLDRLLKIHGVSFAWKDSGRKDVGVIAQDVEAVFPEVVQTNAEGIKSVEYANLIGPVIESLRQLKSENDAMRVEIDALKAEVHGHHHLGAPPRP